MELFLYNSWIHSGENQEELIRLEYKSDDKSLNIVLRVLPYIVGVENFNLAFKKQDKKYILFVGLKRPYGTYKQSLEEQGLIFREETPEEKEIKTADEQSAIQEAETLLASYGLKVAILKR